jgi:hypothetical protein
MGLQDFRRHRSNRFIMFSVCKPAAVDSESSPPHDKQEALLEAVEGSREDFVSVAAAAG